MRIHCNAACLLLALAAGCQTPTVEDTAARPAQVLTVVDSPRIRDGRARFREIFCGLLDERSPELDDGAPRPACEAFLTPLVDEPQPSASPGPWRRETDLRVVVVPGLFNECLREALPLENTVQRLGERGYRSSTLVVSGRSSADHNARQIASYVESLGSTGAERLVLVGYSKGAVDSMHFLVNHPELAGRVAALVSIAGAINGSPLAERFAPFYAGFVGDLDVDGCDEGDAGALESLRPSVRTSWLAHHPLPSTVRYFSLVAHSDAEQVSPGFAGTYHRLAEVDPRNDGQLLAFDQVIPGATLLGYANADHWRIVIDPDEAPANLRHFMADEPFPREILLEAIIIFVAEALPAGQ